MSRAVNKQIDLVARKNQPKVSLDHGSADEKGFHYVEPVTHVKNLSFAQKYCCCSCTKDRDRLTMEELRHFYALKRDANMQFNVENEDHNGKLRNFWLILNGSPLEGEDIKSDGWKAFGFQNTDPRTDFRGGGFMSLQMLIDFSEKHPKLVSQMCEEQNEFYFAISSINITYYMMKFFHLLGSLDLKRDRDDLGNRRALKNFCGLLKKDVEVFSKIHSMLLSDLFIQWLDLRKRIAGTTIMDFGRAIDIVEIKFRKVICSKYFKTFEELQNEYSKVRA
eukprot:TRINITY_DN3958_c0_g1_i2.p1 TRINITY_DN3958_c0_g1~~TRINITY_DN3958_c0_g1_i2.p1  ORF type:complete len:278 (-),score=48.75 TRINITY_DN3958_c0_g1_i2:239-1072(-)